MKNPNVEKMVDELVEYTQTQGDCLPTDIRQRIHTILEAQMNWFVDEYGNWNDGCGCCGYTTIKRDMIELGILSPKSEDKK